MRRIAVSKVYIIADTIADNNTAAPQSPSEIVEQRADMPINNHKTACHIIEEYRNHVADIDDEMNVLNHFPLTEEIAMTEWLGGTLVVRGGKGTLYPTVLTSSELRADDGCGDGHIE